MTKKEVLGEAPKEPQHPTHHCVRVPRDRRIAWREEEWQVVLSKDGGTNISHPHHLIM